MVNSGYLPVTKQGECKGQGGLGEIEERFLWEVIPELHFELLVGTCQTEDRQVGGKTQKTCSVLKTTWGRAQHSTH